MIPQVGIRSDQTSGNIPTRRCRQWNTSRRLVAALVAEHFDEAGDDPVYVVDRRQRAAALEALPVSANVPSLLKGLAGFPRRRQFLFPGFDSRLLGTQDRSRLPDGLGLGVTEHSFGADVPALDPTGRVEQDHREVPRAFDDKPQALFAVAQLR